MIEHLEAMCQIERYAAGRRGRNRNGLRARVLAACDRHGKISTANVMALAGCTRDSGRSVLSKMAKAGILERIGAGVYRRASQ